MVFPGSQDLGAAANVVVRLSKTIPDSKNHVVYFDNFYTTLPLITYLQSRGIYSLGTIRNNRIPNNKLPTDAAVNKQKRGFSTEFISKVDGVTISTSLWKDNKTEWPLHLLALNTARI